MRHKLGQNGTKAKEESSPALSLLLGGAAGVGLYFLTKEIFRPSAPPPGSTQVMPLPAVAPPERFANFASVEARYSQLRDLYHMGPSYKTGPEVIAEINGLQLAAKNFADIGHVDRATAQALITDMEEFKAKVVDTMQFLESLKNQPANGIGRR